MTAPALPPEVVNEVALLFAKRRQHAPTMDGAHNPNPGEIKAAQEAVEIVARALGGDGEPVAWGLTDGKAGQVLEPLFTNVSAAEAAARRTGFLTVVPLYTRRAATGDTGEVERAARTAALYVDEAWRKGAPKSEWHPIKAMLMRDAIRAATGAHPSEARRGHESEGRGGPDAR